MTRKSVINIKMVFPSSSFLYQFEMGYYKRNREKNTEEMLQDNTKNFLGCRMKDERSIKALMTEMMETTREEGQQ